MLEAQRFEHGFDAGRLEELARLNRVSGILRFALDALEGEGLGESSLDRALALGWDRRH